MSAAIRRAIRAYRRLELLTAGRCNFAPVQLSVPSVTPSGLRYTHVLIFSGVLIGDHRPRPWFAKAPGIDLCAEAAVFFEAILRDIEIATLARLVHQHREWTPTVQGKDLPS